MLSCKECNEDKPLSDFYEHCGMKTGYYSKCKKCYNKLDPVKLQNQRCSTCHRDDVPFHSNGGSAYGRQLNCIDCRVKRNQQNWKQKMIENCRDGDIKFQRIPYDSIDIDWINDTLAKQTSHCY